MLLVLKLVPVLKEQFNELINGKSQTNRDQKLKLLSLRRHNQSQKFQLKLVKNRRKALQGDYYLLHWIHYNEKIDDCKNICRVNSFYLLVNQASGYIEEKN